jgi:hypothetical protein
MAERAVTRNRRRRSTRRSRGRTYGGSAPRKGNIFWRRGYNKLSRQVNTIAAMLNVETKYLVTEFAGTVSDTYANENLNLIDQGDGQSSRDGNSCKATKLEVRGYLTHDDTVDSAISRLILMMRIPGGAPVQTEVLKSDSLNAPYNLDTIDRYSILRDEVIVVTTNNPVKYFYWSIPLNNKMKYNNATASYSSNTENSFTLGLFSDRATNGPAIVCTTTLYFVDN